MSEHYDIPKVRLFLYFLYFFILFSLFFIFSFLALFIFYNLFICIAAYSHKDINFYYYIGWSWITYCFVCTL